MTAQRSWQRWLAGTVGCMGVAGTIATLGAAVLSYSALESSKVQIHTPLIFSITQDTKAWGLAVLEDKTIEMPLVQWVRVREPKKPGANRSPAILISAVQKLETTSNETDEFSLYQRLKKQFFVVIASAKEVTKTVVAVVSPQPMQEQEVISQEPKPEVIQVNALDLLANIAVQEKPVIPEKAFTPIVTKMDVVVAKYSQKQPSEKALQDLAIIVESVEPKVQVPALKDVTTQSVAPSKQAELPKMIVKPTPVLLKNPLIKQEVLLSKPVVIQSKVSEMTSTAKEPDAAVEKANPVFEVVGPALSGSVFEPRYAEKAIREDVPLSLVNTAEIKEKAPEYSSAPQAVTNQIFFNVPSIPTPLKPKTVVEVAKVQGPVVVTAPPAAPAPVPTPSASRRSQDALTSLASTAIPSVETNIEASLNAAASSFSATAKVSANRFELKVVEAFSNAAQPLVGVTVQVLGTEIVQNTDEFGMTAFSQLKIKGVLPVIISKPGYLKRTIDLKAHASQQVELISENSERLLGILGKYEKEQDKAMAFGQLKTEEQESIAALQVSLLSNGQAIKPIYLDENGSPNPELKLTSSRGQFLFPNLSEGTYVLTISDAFGIERAPHFVHVNAHEGLVQIYSLGKKKNLSGRIMLAEQADNGAQAAVVQLLGSSKKAITAQDGSFTLGPVYVDCSDLNFLQVDKEGLYRNRLELQCDDSENLQTHFVFSSQAVDQMAAGAQTQLKAEHGVVVGHLNATKPMKVQLWGPNEFEQNETLRGKDYYLGDSGEVKIQNERTEKNGNFTILEAPVGLSYLQVFDKKGRTKAYWPIFTSESTVNVFIH